MLYKSSAWKLYIVSQARRTPVWVETMVAHSYISYNISDTSQILPGALSFSNPCMLPSALVGGALALALVLALSSAFTLGGVLALGHDGALALSLGLGMPF